MKRTIASLAISLAICLAFGTVASAAETPEGKMSEPWLNVTKPGLVIFETKVFSVQGQELGTIKRVVLSDNGCIKYIVLSHDGRLIPIPWRAVKVSPEKHAVVMQISNENLKKAPSVGKTQWTRLDDRKIAQFYTRPYGFWTHPDVSRGPFFPETAAGSGRKDVLERNGETGPSSITKEGKSEEGSVIGKRHPGESGKPGSRKSEE